MFSRILTSALIAGAAAGLVSGLLQFFFVQPVLLHVEMFEGGDLVHFGAGGGASPARVDTGGFAGMRDILSIAFSMLIYSGYGLVLVAVMTLAEANGAVINARNGLIWGVAGFVAALLAPGFSLPPQVPGASAADIMDRQIWWYATSAAAAVALYLIAFGKNPVSWGVAVILLLAPHVIGAPQPDILTGPAPTELGNMFASRAIGVGMVAWVVLGLLAGHFWKSSE